MTSASCGMGARTRCFFAGGAAGAVWLTETSSKGRAPRVSEAAATGTDAVERAATLAATIFAIFSLRLLFVELSHFLTA